MWFLIVCAVQQSDGTVRTMYSTNTIDTYNRPDLCMEDENNLSRGNKVLDVLNGAFVVYGDSAVLRLPERDDVVPVKLSIPKDQAALKWFCRDLRTYVGAGYRFRYNFADTSIIPIAMPTLGMNKKKLMETLERVVDVIFSEKYLLCA